MFKKIATTLITTLAITGAVQAATQTKFLPIVKTAMNAEFYKKQFSNIYPYIKTDPTKNEQMHFYVSMFYKQARDPKWTFALNNNHGNCEQISKSQLKCSGYLTYKNANNGGFIYHPIPDVCISTGDNAHFADSTVLKATDSGDVANVEIVQAEPLDNPEGCITGFTYNFKEHALTTR